MSAVPKGDALRPPGIWFVVVLLALTSGVFLGCGGSSPAEPAPAPAPVPITSLTLNVEGAEPKSVSLAPFDPASGYRTPSADEVGILVMANSIERTTGAQGELRWDPAVLQFSEIFRGSFYEENGASLTNSTHADSCTTPSSGRCRFTVTRLSSAPSISGSGVIVAIYLRRLSTVRSGSTPIQWDATTVGQDGCTITFPNPQICPWWGVTWKGGSVTVSTR